MEFKVGDKVRRIKNLDGNYWRSCCKSSGKTGNEIFEVIKVNDKGIYLKDLKEYDFGFVNFELVNSKSLQETMEKKIYKVLVINKKTGDTDKNQVVTAENEQSAILKAFGVDVENVFIKITEEGSYTEDKPVTAVLVKETKENKTPKAQ